MGIPVGPDLSRNLDYQLVCSDHNSALIPSKPPSQQLKHQLCNTSQPSARFFVPDSFIRQQQEAELQRRRILAQQQEQIRQQLLQRQFQQQQLFQQPAQPNTVGCADFDSRCSVWQQHCQFNAFVAQRCPLTCGFCRFRGQAL
ncbi:unnamed protein product, partial [Mesorhabditis spiculigera]